MTLSRSSSVVYPDSDGERIAEDTLQFDWIVKIFTNLCVVFRQRSDVFVAADLLWYPVEGRPDIRTAPDVMVAMGRPKGHRGSYKEWEEGGAPPTVVFEILPWQKPLTEKLVLMEDKREFYERYGGEEYYVYDPDKNGLMVYLRREDRLRPVRPGSGFVSPLLGIHFDLSGPEMVVYRPDGTPFVTHEEVIQQTLLAEERIKRAEERIRRAERIIELSGTVCRGEASAEELQALERLDGGAN